MSVFGHFEELAFKGLKIKETKRLGIIVTPIQIWRTNLFFEIPITNLIIHAKQKRKMFFLALVNVRFRNLINFFPSVKVGKPLFMNNISHKLVAIKTTQ